MTMSDSHLSLFIFKNIEWLALMPADKYHYKTPKRNKAPSRRVVLVEFIFPEGRRQNYVKTFVKLAVSSGQRKGQRIMIIASQGLGKGLDPVFQRVEVGTSVAPFNSQKSESQENEMRAIVLSHDLLYRIAYPDVRK